MEKQTIKIDLSKVDLAVPDPNNKKYYHKHLGITPFPNDSPLLLPFPIQTNTTTFFDGEYKKDFEDWKKRVQAHIDWLKHDQQGVPNYMIAVLEAIIS